MTATYRLGRADLEYPSRIKLHQPCRAGVLVELAGEFDLACLDALRHALKRVSDLGEPAFIDLAGVAFMDAMCLRELAASAGPRLMLCRPSEQFLLGVAACGLEESMAIVPDNHPGYEAVIAEACRCERSRRTARTEEQHHLYLRAGRQTRSGAHLVARQQARAPGDR